MLGLCLAASVARGYDPYPPQGLPDRQTFERISAYEATVEFFNSPALRTSGGRFEWTDDSFGLTIHCELFIVVNGSDHDETAVVDCGDQWTVDPPGVVVVPDAHDPFIFRIAYSAF